MLRKLLTLIVLCLVSVSYGYAQSGSIQGTITASQSGKLLVGANVYIPEISRGASANAKGQFEINNVPSGTYTLRASFVGYTNATKKVTVNNGTATVNFELKSSKSNLQELVVTGYGAQTTKKFQVSSVSTIEAEQIQKGNTETVEQALQGKTAGVQVTSTSGVLGAPVSVRVRGTTSINASSQPLYVLDGVPLVNRQIGFSVGEPGNQAINPLVNLNPENIKSITVLKDASATAVYGSRGANGVVLIRTKDGQSGRTQVQVGFSGGFTQPTQRYDIATAAQFARLQNYNATHGNGGEVIPDAQPPFGTAFAAPDQLTNFDYPADATRNGSIQNYTASVSGGDDKTQFLISGLYGNQKGYANPNQLQKFNGLVKVNHQFNSQLNTALTLNATRSVDNRISTSNSVAAPYTLAALKAPVVPFRYPNGDINDGVDSDREPLNAFSGFAGTPFGNIRGLVRDSPTTQIVANGKAQYDFVPQLSVKTSFNVQFLQDEEEFRALDFTTNGFPNGTANVLNEQNLNYSWRNTINYTDDWNNNSLNVLAGVTFQKNDFTSISSGGDTFSSNQLLNLGSAANITAGFGSGTSYAFQNNLLRIGYTYKDRYILTLTASYNGSSRFGSNNRYGFFPSAAVGWIISDENFLQPADWLSNLKVKVSYGSVGNANIGNFQQFGLLSGGQNYNLNPGFSLTQLNSPDLSWERTNQLDATIDFGFINNRIRGSAGYYNKDTNDLLLSVPVSPTNGFTGVLQNVGSLTNEGFEFDLSADVISNKNLQWSLSANLSTLRNEVTDIPSRFVIGGRHVVEEGKPLGEFNLPVYAGVDPSNGDALYFLNTQPTNDQLQNGTAKKIDKFGDRFVTNNINAAESQDVGSPQPDFYGGFGSSISFKGIDANVQFQYTQGSKTFYQNGQFIEIPGRGFNITKRALDYWTPDNTDATIPEPRRGNGISPSTRFLLDSSYLRLKNATIGYTLPRQFVNGYKIRLYAQGTNLLTFTGYRGLDPEVTGSSARNVSQGETFFELPQPRTVLFGIQLEF